MAKEYVPYEGPIVTRKDARCVGLTKYFTGTACPKGHIGERGVASGGCLECIKISKANLRRSDPGRAYAGYRKWREANRDKLNAKNREKTAARRISGSHRRNYDVVSVHHSGEIILRPQAVAEGLDRYFDGQSCRNGHLCQRFTSNWCCVECHRAAQKRLYRKHADARRERNKKARVANIGFVRAESRRRYYSYYREKQAENSRRWVEKNKDRVRLAGRLWRARNPLRARAIAHARRCALRSGGRYSSDEARSILEAQRWKCIYCKRNLRRTGYEIDHKIPVSRGGKNIASNLQCLCPGCNRWKSARDHFEYARHLGMLL